MHNHLVLSSIQARVMRRPEEALKRCIAVATMLPARSDWLDSAHALRATLYLDNNLKYVT